MTAKKQVEPVMPYKDFARRLKQAFDTCSTAPEGHGRLKWMADRLAEKGINYRTESVRKWLLGATYPRPKVMQAIAQILGKDRAWLAVGSPEVTPVQRAARNAAVGGSVNVVAGFIQMSGGSASFPDAGNPRHSGFTNVDIIAIINHDPYYFHVSTAQEAGDAFVFSVPAEHDRCVVLGVVPLNGFAIDIVELTPEVLTKHGTTRTGEVQIRVHKRGRDYVVGRSALRKISNFARL